MNKKLVEVVAAVIENEKGEILCALRSPIMTLPNMWEFPGGKVEEGESLYTAIEREIKEELKCSVKATEIIGENTHEYENIIVNLTALKCVLVEGKPVADEHSKLIYLKKENLESLLWAPADIPLVQKVINSKK
ncbi:(deoxy)nucleoside triphosphate pyrophosphohydrolase [Intestinibacter bartlettii]|nr:(deoxy)nucleoside triphosphate pyrophosphohydrolase [Intestinibacter bartlettii]MDO5011587.1 (deoxy)nucleoside triphosphate pyrophosphohydrolase [Intestinibacter bartlettii]